TSAGPFVLFIQAEDGIRATLVTGVQTCALPISTYSADCPAGSVNLAAGESKTCTVTNTKQPKLTVVKVIVGGNGGTDNFDVKVRSEERREGEDSKAPRGNHGCQIESQTGSHYDT